MTTGERIKLARKAAGLTQTELAEKIGVKFSAIHKYESGMVVNLKRETIAALADALDVKPSWLMCMDDDPVRELARQTAEHQRLIELWDRADEIDRNTIWSILSRYDEKGAGSSASAG